MGLGHLIKWVQDNLQVTQPSLLDPPRPQVPFVDRPRPPIPDWLMIDDPRRVIRIHASDELSIEPGGPFPPSQSKPKGLDEWSVDALAYYVPYHFSGKRWGIYISASGVAYLSATVKRAAVSPTDDAVVNLAFRVLFEHEVFHFCAETASARTEFATKSPLYSRYFYSPDARLLEEALANAHAYRATIRGASAHFGAPLSTFMKGSPPGYCDFDEWLKSAAFERGKRNVVAHMMAPIHKPLSIPSLWPTEYLFGRLSRSFAPTRLIIDVDVPWLRIAKKYPAYKGIRVVTHSREHPPAHFHIEIPPGKVKTKYLWPELKPLSGYPPLSGDEEKVLAEYLAKHGHKIQRRLESVFGPLSAATVQTP